LRDRKAIQPVKTSASKSLGMAVKKVFGIHFKVPRTWLLQKERMKSFSLSDGDAHDKNDRRLSIKGQQWVSLSFRNNKALCRFGVIYRRLGLSLVLQRSLVLYLV